MTIKNGILKDINGNIIHPEIATASTSQLGGVKVDGTSITIDNGVISTDTSEFLTQEEASETFQEKLVSGTNIKTINNQSLLGEGNVTISGSNATWGNITGTLSDQTDLNTVLEGKVEKNTEFALSTSDDSVEIIDTLGNSWIYTNNGATGDTAIIKTSTAYNTIKYNVSNLIGESIHVYTKWHSQDLPIPVVVFVTSNATIIERKLYSDYATSGGKVITIDEDFIVPENATQVWVASTKADLPLPKVKLTTPLIKTVKKTLDEIAKDYLNTVSSSDNIVLQPEATYSSFFQVNNNRVEIQAASANYSTNEYSITEGKQYLINTEWQSGDGNVYIIAFTNDDNEVLLSKQYKNYGSGKIIVADTLEAPSNATKLFVSWRNEFNAASCTELTSAELHTISLTKAIDDRISKAVIPSTDSSKSINMLFIGNSLTQDGVSYVPWILKRLYPDIQFKFWMWYCGGYQLYQHLAKFNNHQTCEIASYTDNTQTGWSNYNNSKTIDDMLGSGVKFDVISIQEYFTYKSTYGESDIQVFKDTLGYIADHYPYPYYLAELFHQPHLTQESKSIDIDDRFAWQVQCTQQMWNKLPIQSIIPTGFASYRATKTDLNSLGDVGGLSPDYTHCQEGLPCQMLAWVTTQWILRHIGYPTGMYNDPTPITQAIYNTLSIPGANIGSGLVTGTTEQYRLAQQVAMNALKECDSTFKFTTS